MTIEKLHAHYGFTKMPFRRDLAPGMLHRHGAHAEAAARISWCISEHALGVITGEVGAGKTVALRAALASLDASRHTLIYLGNPSVGVRGINHAIVAALGGVPKTHHATLTPQAMDLLAREHAERGRIPVLAIDEAHMLEPAQLEAVRMLTNHDLDSGCPLACLLIGQPTLRRRIKLGILAALDQRIAVRYTMPGMTSRGDLQLHHPPPDPRRPVRAAVQRRRHHPDPRHQPRPAPRRQQPRHPGAHRRLRRPQSHRRRIQPPAPPPPKSRQTDHQAATTNTKAPPEHHRRGFSIHLRPHRQRRRHHQTERPRTAPAKPGATTTAHDRPACTICQAETATHLLPFPAAATRRSPAPG